MNISISSGKYTVIQNEDGSVEALLHGEKWRNCTGDKLILALAQEIETLRTPKVLLINKCGYCGEDIYGKHTDTCCWKIAQAKDYQFYLNRLAITPICDHMFSGNACCPCGAYTNGMVKSVCVYTNKGQTWPQPHGTQGMAINKALTTLRHLSEHTSDSTASLLKLAWDSQMINGEKYIEALKSIDSAEARQIIAEELLK